ncbi:C40 family peptidase [Variovorax sp. VNK109]|uniref:C40 family peptidase n=1 Tax=Variovorax sp. VNK109 TaxID=3400919 RepID=UPI003C0E9FF7
MRSALIAAVVLLMAQQAVAAPQAHANASDDMDKFLSDRGLVEQFNQVRQTVQDKTSELVVTAMGFLGVPYKRGGNSAEAGGFDCSGFVKAMYEQTIGLVLPRKAEQQAAATQKIEKTELKPGDLVFFNTLRRTFSHVGIYVGDGKFIHSPKPGAEVRVESMQSNYWQRRFDGARRVTPAESQAQLPANAAAASLMQTAAPAAPAPAASANQPRPYPELMP